MLKKITIKEADLGVQGIVGHLSLKTLSPAHKITLSISQNSTEYKFYML